MNTGAPWLTLEQAEARVLGIQTKLHQWATDDPLRRFDDLYNLVGDPAFLLVAWHVNGHQDFPVGGHRISRLMAIRNPGGWPAQFPVKIR